VTVTADRMDAVGLALPRRVLIFGSAALAVSACAPRRRAASAAGVLNVASQKGTTRALLQASGALVGAPYKVAWSEFAAASPLLEALGANAVDIGGVGDAPFLFAYAAGAKIKAVFAYRSGSSGASVAVVVPQASPLRTVADLRGRRVATVKGSVGHYLLLRVLDKAGLPLDAAHAVFLNPGDCKAALDRGSVDAWSTWSPYVGLATLHGGDRILADGRGLFAGYSFMAATDAAIATKRPLLADFLKRLASAYAWGRSHPADYAQALAKDTGLPLDVAHDLVSRQDAVPTPVTPQIAAAETQTLSLYRRAGVATTQAPVDQAFDPSFNTAVYAAATGGAPSQGTAT
jgi:sulfonate transport system substrate-binding protein